MEIRGIDQMVSELRAVAAQAASAKPAQTAAPDAPDFGEVLKGAIDQVNHAQQQAQQMAQDFSAGAPGANLQDVMVNLQKASLSFQQMVQVRNRLVSAYHDIMNMQM